MYVSGGQRRIKQRTAHVNPSCFGGGLRKTFNDLPKRWFEEALTESWWKGCGVQQNGVDVSKDSKTLSTPSERFGLLMMSLTLRACHVQSM